MRLAERTVSRLIAEQGGIAWKVALVARTLAGEVVAFIAGSGKLVPMDDMHLA